MDNETLISEGLYKITSDIIGAEPIINMRRKMMDVRANLDHIELQVEKRIEERLYSGSKAEGLRFKSSDDDWMLVMRGVRVIFSLSQCSELDNEQTVLLAESNKTKPGFVLLQLISNTTDTQIVRSCLQHGTKYYLSNSLWVRHGVIAHAWPDSFPHGPCRSGFLGNAEFDYAECLKSDTLPTSSQQTLFKLHQAGHLKRDTLENIHRTGCHFVAICSKNPVHEHLEWRISFSSIEKVLIYSMNQTQFLCYGLLKIFLKEAIDVQRDIKGLLCSYFMKTAVFWKLLDEDMRWSPQHYLECFWKCLQMLINWVNVQYCPNFFIPENNMLSNKFTRAQHSALLRHLSDFCDDGIHCLLRCPSLSINLTEILKRPILVITPSSDLDYVSKSKLETEMIREMLVNSQHINDSDSLSACVKYLEHVLSRDRHQHPYLGIWRKILINRLIFIRGCRIINRNRDELNRSHYKVSRRILSTMQSCAVDATTHLIYSGVYLYRCGRYNETLQVMEKVKSRLQDPSISYVVQLCEHKYAAEGGETRPLLDVMKSVIVFPVVLLFETRIPELLMEHQAVGIIFGYNLYIQPLVCANFIIYLSHCQLGSGHSASAVLQELYALLHYDDGYHISETNRALSLEILGICQEMSGDYHGAYRSYSLALQQKWCPIKSASKSRLRKIRHHCETSLEDELD